MLLRSSSTPVLGSLLSSFIDSPSNGIHCETSHTLKHLPPLPSTSFSHNNHKLSYYQSGSLNLFSVSCNSSPISPSIADFDRHYRGFRRVQSEGNLQDLAYASCNRRALQLETIPSFSFSNCKSLREEDEESEFGEGQEEMEEEKRIVNKMIVTEEVTVENGTCSVGFGELQEMMAGKAMHVAKGLGIEGCGGGLGGCRGGGGGGSGGGGDYNSMGSGGDDGVEEYYKKMVEENPGNTLVLRNYAQFLYQCKRDLHGAEEYYSRAILTDPNDGEVLSQYGKLVWEAHHDQGRAISYFERAVQASPQDSHVHAAYASFLWDTEEDEDSCHVSQALPPQLHQEAVVVSASASRLKKILY